MEGKRYIIAVFLIMLCHYSAEATFRDSIFGAYLRGDMVQWKRIIDRMEQEKRKDPGVILELLGYQYGYIGYSLGSGKNDEARVYLRLAQDNLELLMAAGYKPAKVFAYQSALYGFEIGLRRLRAPFLGPRSTESARRAMELDAGEPLGFIQYGNIQYYMPGIFGGSKKLALEYYLKSLELYEMDMEDARSNWVYLNLLVIIARAFEDLGQVDMARKYYEKSLEVAPEFSWVKNELYPRFLRKYYQ